MNNEIVRLEAIVNSVSFYFPRVSGWEGRRWRCPKPIPPLWPLPHIWSYSLPHIYMIIFFIFLFQAQCSMQSCKFDPNCSHYSAHKAVQHRSQCAILAFWAQIYKPVCIRYTVSSLGAKYWGGTCQQPSPTLKLNWKNTSPHLARLIYFRYSVKCAPFSEFWKIWNWIEAKST